MWRNWSYTHADLCLQLKEPTKGMEKKDGGSLRSRHNNALWEKTDWWMQAYLLGNLEFTRPYVYNSPPTTSHCWRTYTSHPLLAVASASRIMSPATNPNRFRSGFRRRRFEVLNRPPNYPSVWQASTICRDLTSQATRLKGSAANILMPDTAACSDSPGVHALIGPELL